ncbi:MAG: hypothetical protein ACK5HR_04575 [Mycoplasmatales bacterium]
MNVFIGTIGSTVYKEIKYKLTKDNIQDKQNNVFDNIKIKPKQKNNLDELLCSIPFFEILHNKKDSIDKLLVIGPEKVKFKKSEKGDKLGEKYSKYVNVDKESGDYEVNLKSLLEGYYKISKSKYELLPDKEVNLNYNEFYDELVKEINISKANEIKLTLDISNGRRDIQNNIYNLIPAFENINGYEIEHVYYGFLDNSKSDTDEHSIFDYKNQLDENKIIEKLKMFLNNYTVDEEFKGIIESEGANQNYLKEIEIFYNAFHLNNLQEVYESIKKLKDKEIEDIDSLVGKILEKIQKSFKTNYENDKDFLDDLKDDLLKKEYYQQLVTMLEGEFRKQVIKNYTDIEINNISSKDLYNISEYLFSKSTKKADNSIKRFKYELDKYKCSSIFKNQHQKWKEFKNFRNPLNHGTQLEQLSKAEEEFKRISTIIIDLIKESKNENL